MGGCCSVDKMFERSMRRREDDEEDEVEEEEEDEYVDDGHTCEGDYGARVRLKGCSKLVSMFTQQGRKGVNQDAMTVWENFGGVQDAIFCCIFDGHGPIGHKVAAHVRDVLPSKLSAELASPSKFNSNIGSDDNDGDESKEGDEEKHASISSYKASIIKTFKDMDKDLSSNFTTDSFCSGTTAVTILVQGENMIVANLGDSRAILCTRDQKNHRVPVQLTVDLKPNLPGEAERIKRCNGRVFAMEEEPDVYRLWLPDENSPGLAMARAFGDFCLKDFGLIPIPQVSYRKLSKDDEFVVLATDGVWDVLSNKDVIKIVASVKKRSTAAELVVRHAVRAWKCKYPTSKIDDCAVVCLFLDSLTSPTRSSPIVREVSADRYVDECSNTDTSNESEESAMGEEAQEWRALEGVTRANSVVKIPRFACNPNDNSSQNRSTGEEGG
ncbi:hypothetical protein Sjap_014247 [Stephania japonica]|uniref:PPM-type phosphatase domain-containing protein n=1 Tax=Stephania japonica TaxID=461633 RepID=A0AAP0P0S0_9MAGN